MMRARDLLFMAIGMMFGAVVAEIEVRRRAISEWRILRKRLR